jgi:hypothetical protein
LSVERWAVGCIALNSLSFQIYSYPFKLMKLLNYWTMNWLELFTCQEWQFSPPFRGI